MKDIKATIISAVVALVVAGGFVLTFEPTEQIIDKTITRNVPVGSVSSPDIPSPYLQWGGVNHWAQGTALSGAASTTICALQSPTASSSLQNFGIRLNTGTTTSMTLKAYKSASRFLTTTQFTDNVTLPSNTEVVAYATTTTANNLAFTGGDWIVVTATVAAGGNGTSSPTGYCQAEWTSL